MKNQVKLEKKVMEFANTLHDKGYTLADIQRAMFHRGLTIFRTMEDLPSSTDIVLGTSDKGGITITHPMPGHEVQIRPIGTKVTRLVGDDDVEAEYPPMSISRMMELLDYASCYGEYDENTPNGTPSRFDGEGGHGMNDYRRAAIVLLKKALGFLPPVGEGEPMIFPDHGYRADQLEGVAREARDLVHGYAQHHLAKTPPDLDKAARNVRMAEKLSLALGDDYQAPPIPSESPQEAARNAQERDLLPGTGDRPYKGSTAPLDRQEMLAWIDMKLDGCAKHGMREASDILQAMRGEIAQHLEAAPIDFAVALRAHFDDVHGRNVKAGWWSDLATGNPKKRSVGELFMLFVTELAEAYEAYISGNAPDDKLPHLPGLAVELGDLEIRFADFCGALQAGKIVRFTGTRNPGDEMFEEVTQIARRYESIRKTDAAVGDPETGEPLEPQDVAGAIVEKLEFNATRADHKIENRLKDDGKRT